MTRRHHETDPPDDLAEADRRALLAWAKRMASEHRIPREYATARWMRETVDEVLDWHTARGIQRVSWPATVRNRVRALAAAERGDAPWQRERDRRERPQEPRDGDGELMLIFGGKR